MNIYSFKLIFCLFLLNFIMIQASETFVATKETCGAAVKLEGQEKVKDTINERIACMIKGFKDVYWGSANELNTIDSTFLPLENNNIEKIIIDPKYGFGFQGLLLYTPRGEKNARLFLRMLEKSFGKKLYKGGTFYNEYLAGMLLGYSPDDIEHYYKTVIKHDVQGMNDDKKEAEEFIVRETPDVEEEIKQNKQRKLEQQQITLQSNGEVLKKTLNSLTELLDNLYKQLTAI